MSVWASAVGWTDDEHADQCAGWRECGCGDWPGEHHTPPVLIEPDGAHYELTGGYDCRAGPLACHGSHVLPSDDGARAGWVDVAEIPGHVSQGDRGPLDAPEGSVWPWLRLSVNEATVVLDRGQVGELAGYLGRWLERSDTT